MVQRQEHLFVIRMWLEHDDAGPVNQPLPAAPWGPGWRGVIQHVPSGERTYFIHSADLAEFLRSHLLCQLPAASFPGIHQT